METEFEGKTTKHTLMQLWPVRAPRPVAEKHTADYPLLTGQRILWRLFNRSSNVDHAVTVRKGSTSLRSGHLQVLR